MAAKKFTRTLTSARTSAITPSARRLVREPLEVLPRDARTNVVIPPPAKAIGTRSRTRKPQPSTGLGVGPQALLPPTAITIRSTIVGTATVSQPIVRLARPCAPTAGDLRRGPDRSVET